MTVIGEAWVKVKGDVGGFGKEIERSLNAEMGPVAEAEGKKHGGGFGRAFTGGTSEGMSGLKLAVLGATAAVGAGVIAAGVGLYKLGADFKDVSNDIRVKTGATGAKLDALNDSFKRVAGQVPESFKATGEVVAALAQKLDLTGKPLEALSVQMLNLAHITKGDVNAQMDAAVQLFRNFGVSADQQGPTLDKLYRAAQASGVGFDQLAASMTSAGPTLRGMGLDVDHAAAFIAALGKAGVDAAQVMPALGKAAATAAKEHKSAAQLFEDTFSKIKGAKSDIDASGDAVSVFGAKAGPRLATLIREGKLSMDDMLKTISGGKDTINSATKDTEDFGEKWDKIKNRTLVGLEPIASAVFDAVGRGMDYISDHADGAIGVLSNFGDIVEQVATAFKFLMDGDVQGFGASLDATLQEIVPGAKSMEGTFDSLGQTITTVMTDAKMIVEGVVDFIREEWQTHAADIKAILGKYVETFRSEFEAVSAVISKVVEIVTVLWERFGQTLLGKIRVAIDAIIEIVKGFLDFMKGIFDLITAVLTGKWGKAWDAIKEIMKGAWEIIHGALRAALDLISTAIEGAKAAISAAWSAIWHGLNTLLHDAWDGYIALLHTDFDLVVGFVAGMPGRIAKAASGMWDGLKDAFKSAINWIIQGWNSLEFTLPSVDTHIPGVGKIGGWTLGTPDIPLLAAGGIVTSPTLAVVGDAGPEAVIPLSQGGGALAALLGSIPAGWTIPDYVSNLVHAVEVALQSTEGLVVDWVAQTARAISSGMSAAAVSLTSALDGAAQAEGAATTATAAFSSAATAAADAIGQAAAALASAASDAASRTSTPSGSSGGGSYGDGTGDGQYGGPSLPPASSYGGPGSIYMNGSGSSWMVGLDGQTWVPMQGFAAGTSYVAQDMTARVHQGERILSRFDNAALIAAVSGASGGSSRPIVVQQTNEFHGTTEELRAYVDEANERLVQEIAREMAAGVTPGAM